MLLKLGNKGLRVVRLQLQLRALGHYSGLIHGYFDEELDQAVRSFQNAKGLVVDGLVGPITNIRLVQDTKDDWFLLFLHCSATPEGRDDSAQKIVNFHTLPRSKGGRGWSRPGYSDLLELDGDLVNARDYNQDNMIGSWEYTFGVHGSTLLNRNARHFCYVGGMNKNLTAVKDTRTPKQLENMETYIKYQLLRNPKLVIAGHNQVQAKGCPSFEVPEYLESIGVGEYNHGIWGEMWW